MNLHGQPGRADQWAGPGRCFERLGFYIPVELLVKTSKLSPDKLGDMLNS